VTPLLELRSVHYRHPSANREAVHGVSLQVQPREIVGIIGPNAAGKSTLARLACGLLLPVAGEVLLLGDAMPRLSRRERARRAAYLPQDPPSDLGFTAREVALMGRAPHLGLWSLEGPGDRARADAALAEAAATDLADRPLSQLSGGEQKRVFLARAFAQDAKLLILDEPTDGLDLAHQVHLVQVLRARRSSGGGALLILHDLALAAAACDRLVLLDSGKVRAEGTPREVLRPEVLEAAYGTAIDVTTDAASGALLVAPRIAREPAPVTREKA
jgi:iron complex transport system ATP-binding protein